MFVNTKALGFNCLATASTLASSTSSKATGRCCLSVTFDVNIVPVIPCIIFEPEGLVMTSAYFSRKTRVVNVVVKVLPFVPVIRITSYFSA